VRGIVERPFTIDEPLALQGDRGLVRIRMIVDAAGQQSITDVAPLRVDVARARSLVRCVPRTGRQHQLRAHLAHAGFPIVGDKLYAHGDRAFRRFCDEGLTPELAALFQLPRQALHAHEVRFHHPHNSTEVNVISPLAPELRTFLERAALGS